MRRKLEPARERIQLRYNRNKHGQRHDLHGYLFQDTDHAVRWLSQKYVKDFCSVAIVMARENIFGENVVTKVIRKLTVEEFFAAYA